MTNITMLPEHDAGSAVYYSEAKMPSGIHQENTTFYDRVRSCINCETGLSCAIRSRRFTCDGPKAGRPAG